MLDHFESNHQEEDTATSSSLSVLFFVSFFGACRINAVGHFTQRLVPSAAGQTGDVTAASHSTVTGDASHPKSLDHVQRSSVAVLPFSQGKIPSIC